MKKNDVILIIVIAFVSLVAYFIMDQTVKKSELNDGIAIVVFQDNPILEINLIDGSYQIIDDTLGITVDESLFLYTIPDTNGTNDLIIEYKDHKVRVIEETSPQNICQDQGWSNSPLRPITCLPNNLVILIKTNEPSIIDDVSS